MRILHFLVEDQIKTTIVLKMQPLATCMHNLQLGKMAIGMQISEPWLREYQVGLVFLMHLFGCFSVCMMILVTKRSTDVPFFLNKLMQVLPSRTHPCMQMNAFGGYILSGTKISPN